MDKKFIIGFVILIILILSIMIIINKEEVFLRVSCENIPNSSDEYIIITLIDSKGNIVNCDDTISIEILDLNGNINTMGDLEPLKNGKSIIRYPKGDYIIKAKFNGNIHYNEAFITKNITLPLKTTKYTDDDLTTNSIILNPYGDNEHVKEYLT